MAGVEFLPEPDDLRDAGRRRPPGHRPVPTARLLSVLAALVAVATAAVVVVDGGGSVAPSGGAAAPTPSTRSTSAPRPSPGPQLLDLPAADLFRGSTIGLVVDGNVVYLLTPTVVGVANRDGGELSVRPAPFGLTSDGVRGTLLYDSARRLLWVVALGGRSIGAYEPAHLDSLADFRAPAVINGAAAMAGRLWLTTDRGLFTVGLGGVAHRVPGVGGTPGAIAADPQRHSALVSSGSGRDLLLRVTASGVRRAELSPLSGVTPAVVDGRIWAGAYAGVTPEVVELDPRTLQVSDASAVTGVLGRHVELAATFGSRFVVRGDHVLVCVDARHGLQLQTWPVPRSWTPHAAVALNQRGLLVATPQGIATLDATACLDG